MGIALRRFSALREELVTERACYRRASILPDGRRPMLVKT